MTEIILPENELSAWQWWESRRLQYNLGLIVAGICAFGLYILIYCVFGNRLPIEIDITIFTILFQAIGYFFYLFLANLLYCLGALSEKLPMMRSLADHRKFVFRFGFFVSVSLPFLEPTSLAYAALSH